MRPRMGDLGNEGEQFSIALLDAVDRPRCEEAISQPANQPLNAAFLIGLADVAQR